MVKQDDEQVKGLNYQALENIIGKLKEIGSILGSFVLRIRSNSCYR